MSLYLKILQLQMVLFYYNHFLFLSSCWLHYSVQVFTEVKRVPRNSFNVENSNENFEIPPYARDCISQNTIQYSS